MSFFLVVHHPQDEYQPRKTEWLDENRLLAIETTALIAERCAVAKRRGERIYVHRRRYLELLSTICCSLKVDEVRQEGDHGRVTFCDHRLMDMTPQIRPVKDQESYGSA